MFDVQEMHFMPHVHCYLGDQLLVWTMFWTDLLIGLAYVGISLTLWALVQKIKIPFSFIVLSFGVFIGACGATHFMEVWTLWHPDYWIAAILKIVTAIASVSTGIWLVKLRPQIMSVAEAAKLSTERKALLEKLNIELLAQSAELEEKNQQLQTQQKILAHSAKMSALGEMAGGIAHEINSPLGIITVHANQLERLQQRGKLTPEILIAESQLISSTAKRVGEIIKGLRAFAREGDKDPFARALVSSIIQDAIVLCKTRFEVHHVRIEVKEISSGLEIECRAVQISQVILNLLTNAFDAVQVLQAKWVSIEIRDDVEHVVISVIDSGSGIPPALLPKLMEPFFTTKEIGKGTGLGLSISKGIIESHHGTLEVDSSHPHTRFVLRLPKKQPGVISR